MNLPNIKLCRKCDNPFDIATDFDWCPSCREKEIKKDGEGDGTKY